MSTQAEFRRRLRDVGVDVSRKAVSKWERDECLPSVTYRPLIFIVLGVHGERQRQLRMAMDGYADFPPVQEAA